MVNLFAAAPKCIATNLRAVGKVVPMAACLNVSCKEWGYEGAELCVLVLLGGPALLLQVLQHTEADCWDLPTEKCAATNCLYAAPAFCWPSAVLC